MCLARSDLQCSDHIGTLGQGKIKIFFSNWCALPRVLSHSLGNLNQSYPKRTLMKIEHVSSIYADETMSVSALVFTIHVSSSTYVPIVHALLAFVTTPETQKKKAPHKRRMRIETYQEGFLKTIKFPSWHSGAARRHGRTTPE